MDLSNTLKYINLAGVNIGLVALRGPMHLRACVSEKRGDGGARLGSVPLGRHFRFGGSQS